jgi:hypothetical protein
MMIGMLACAVRWWVRRVWNASGERTTPAGLLHTGVGRA